MIDDIHAIRTLLTRLIGERAPLSVFFEGVGDRHSSVLLGIDDSLGALLVDELHPADGHLRVTPGASLRWVGRIDGVDVRFRACVRAIDRDGAAAAYLIEIPTLLDYRERRGSYRVRATPTVALRAELKSLAPVASGTGAAESIVLPCARVEAALSDISIDGISFALQWPHALRAQQRWTCTLHLPDGALDTTIAICHVRQARRCGQKDRIGARFIDLSGSACSRISRHAASIQRQRLRMRPRSCADASA